MPTGYTADVQNGKITEFADFALRCARAFGALVTMRDDPTNAPIPDEFKPSLYHDEQLAAARMNLAALETMTPEEVATAAHKDELKRIAADEVREAKRSEQKARYEAMLAKVEAWQPPTPDHEGLKKFMAEQLAGSIDFDCRPYPVAPECSPEEWLAAQMTSAQWNVQYHADEGDKERERAKKRTAWVRSLKASLAAAK